ncbi:MAG TPA: hypothetical protein VGC56_10940 [Allosphingosinicella sp.]
MAEEPWEPNSNFSRPPETSFLGCLMVGCGVILVLTGGSCAFLAFFSQDWSMTLIALLIFGAGAAAIAYRR